MALSFYDWPTSPIQTFLFRNVCTGYTGYLLSHRKTSKFGGGDSTLSPTVIEQQIVAANFSAALMTVNNIQTNIHERCRMP